MSGVELGGVVAAAQAGDEGAFTELVQRYRRELQVHCYRMLGSVVESEDLVQETFLKAWTKRESSRAGRRSGRGSTASRPTLASTTSPGGRAGPCVVSIHDQSERGW
jgi:hypothetical protein